MQTIHQFLKQIYSTYTLYNLEQTVISKMANSLLKVDLSTVRIDDVTTARLERRMAVYNKNWNNMFCMQAVIATYSHRIS